MATTDEQATVTAGDHLAADAPLCDSSLVAAFGLLGKRWNGILLGVLVTGPLGFADLRRGAGGITDSVLSDRLTELSDAGLVQRSVTNTRPPGVLYSLTDSGTALTPILRDLTVWAGDNLGPRCTEALRPER